MVVCKKGKCRLTSKELRLLFDLWKRNIITKKDLEKLSKDFNCSIVRLKNHISKFEKASWLKKQGMKKYEQSKRA